MTGQQKAKGLPSFSRRSIFTRYPRNKKWMVHFEYYERKMVEKMTI